jgi:palmitoyl-protein thioesterase
MYHLLPFSLLLLLAPALSKPLHKRTTTSHDDADPLPLVIWHGLGDNYAAEGLHQVGDLAEQVNPGTFVYYIRLDENPDSDRTATFLGNVTEQLAKVCADLAAHPIISTAPAINALGFSQGGQFLRGYVERCNTPPVRNLVTYGSQHNGIEKYQVCGPTDWVCKAWVGLLKGNTWSHYVQSHLVPAQYFRSVDESTGEASDEYLEYSNFLADINNERREKNKTYAENIAKLEKFVMYMFEDDVTVIPKETGWFAQVNTTSEEVTPLRERTIYKEDWIGLKKLDEKGGLVFRTTPGAHMQLVDEDLTDVFKTYFAPPKSTLETVFDKVQEILEL